MTAAPTDRTEELAVPAQQRGVTQIGERVIERIAVHVAGEVQGVWSVPVSGIRRMLVWRGTQHSADAASESEWVTIDLELAVESPRPIAPVTAEVRRRVMAEVTRLTGMTVESLSITVPQLISGSPSHGRVQ